MNSTRLLCGAGTLLVLPALAHGQCASLYGIPGHRPAITLADSSWYYQEIEPIKDWRVNDSLVVIVDEKTQVTSEAEVERRKRSSIDARLQDWIHLDGLDLKPAPQSDGEPRIRASLNNQLRAEMDLESRDSMRFRIAVRVVDIRPNGNLVVEGTRTIDNNNERWVHSVSGEVRQEDILPNRTVLSERLMNPRICKHEEGHVRDGTKRGWLLRFVDKVKPF
jgi:flagellar L-ring protein FlgH